MADDAPKIQIDSDWKAQAQAEKQKLAEQAKSKAPAGQPGAGPAAAQGAARQLPPASFESLVSTMTTQALYAMGAVPDPRTGQRMQNLDLARFHIDTLSVIEDKTKGNLTDEEQQVLSGTLFELRQRYVQIATAMRGV